jgi:hypothetical protein
MPMKEQLLIQLGERGWNVIRHSKELEWWAKEIWVLESLWAPRGFRVFLTFLTDPQPGSTEPFWALRASTEWPTDRNAPDEPFLLFREWEDQLPGFSQGLEELRIQASAG